jgi:hypothetical protein
MADRHKHSPVRFRPSEGNRERIAAHAAETGLAVNAILNRALDVFWQVNDGRLTTVPAMPDAAGPHEAGPQDPGAPGRGEVPVVKSGRRPPVAVAVPFRAPVEPAASPGDEEPGPATARQRPAKGPAPRAAGGSRTESASDIAAFFTRRSKGEHP